MQTAATTSSATLSGQVATPLSVSGVTTAPSRIPTRTKHRRASGGGTFTALPPSAATATINIEPQTSPPGKPISWKPNPPPAAKSHLPLNLINSRRGGKGNGNHLSPTLGAPGKGAP